MPIIQDPEFGTITIRRNPRSRQVRIRVAPDGTLKASMPPYTPLIFLKRMVKTSREELRAMIAASIPKTVYADGQAIGTRHTLVVRNGAALGVARRGRTITVSLPEHLTLQSPEVEQLLRAAVIKALRIEAKEYLPKRLEQLARAMECQYGRVRFSHASSRWGSCSSAGTISLNIALMKLPLHLIDYVLIHELAHTKEMNHSADFWDIVARYDPDYKKHRSEIQSATPSI